MGWFEHPIFTLHSVGLILQYKSWVSRAPPKSCPGSKSLDSFNGTIGDVKWVPPKGGTLFHIMKLNILNTLGYRVSGNSGSRPLPFSFFFDPSTNFVDDMKSRLQTISYDRKGTEGGLC